MIKNIFSNVSMFILGVTFSVLFLAGCSAAPKRDPANDSRCMYVTRVLAAVNNGRESYIYTEGDPAREAGLWVCDK